MTVRRISRRYCIIAFIVVVGLELVHRGCVSVADRLRGMYTRVMRFLRREPRQRAPAPSIASVSVWTVARGDEVMRLRGTQLIIVKEDRGSSTARPDR